MAKLDQKELDSQRRKAMKSGVFSGLLTGAKYGGFSQITTIGKSVRFQPNKTGIALGAVSSALQIKALYHSYKSAKSSNTPLGTFIKTNFLTSLSSTSGHFAGATSLLAIKQGALKLRLKTAAYAASDAVKARRASRVISTVVSSSMKRPTGQYVFRRVGRKIIPIRVDRLELPHLKG